MTCWLFGHRLPLVSQDLSAQVEQDNFICRRCGKSVPWEKMDRGTQSFRSEVRIINRHTEMKKQILRERNTKDST